MPRMQKKSAPLKWIKTNRTSDNHLDRVDSVSDRGGRGYPVADTAALVGQLRGQVGPLTARRLLKGQFRVLDL